MQEKFKKIKQEVLKELKRTETLEQLENIYRRYFSRTSGEFSQLFKDLKNVAEKEKPVIGKLVNDFKNEAEKLYEEIKKKLIFEEKKQPVGNNQSFFDITLPGEEPVFGHLHLLTQTKRDIENIFVSIGFMVADGPELESEWYNFEALNIPHDHPARDMQDTFYIKKQNIISENQKDISANQDQKLNMVMRTHTSNVQVRMLETYGAPLRCVAPGRVFRNEATDARHEHTFYQIEGLMVDEKISLANLKAVVDTLIKALLGQQFETRIRPGYFPFVEPGLEVDLSCSLCQKRGCRVCKNTGWVEFMGAGMVHPNVLKAGGVDPDKYSGFAFGFGLERLAMMKHGIDDIRLFESGDLRFLRQF